MVYKTKANQHEIPALPGGVHVKQAGVFLLLIKSSNGTDHADPILVQHVSFIAEVTCHTARDMTDIKARYYYTAFGVADGGRVGRDEAKDMMLVNNNTPMGTGIPKQK
ncbi:MAG: hypothetical protein WDO71_28255 [Bacteroidota bacterium]